MRMAGTEGLTPTPRTAIRSGSRGEWPRCVGHSRSGREREPFEQNLQGAVGSPGGRRGDDAATDEGTSACADGSMSSPTVKQDCLNVGGGPALTHSAACAHPTALPIGV